MGVEYIFCSSIFREKTRHSSICILNIKSKMMEQNIQSLVKSFCLIANWTYECWQTHKILFENNSVINYELGHFPHFSERVSIIIQEYSILQICKLHESMNNKRPSLTLDYVIGQGEWGSDFEQLQELNNNLNNFYLKLKIARDKIIAHSDAETYAKESTLGAFIHGEDCRYFSDLQTAVNIIHENTCGGPYPFNDLASSDAKEFILNFGKNKSYQL